MHLSDRLRLLSRRPLCCFSVEAAWGTLEKVSASSASFRAQCQRLTPVSLSRSGRCGSDAMLATRRQAGDPSLASRAASCSSRIGLSWEPHVCVWLHHCASLVNPCDWPPLAETDGISLFHCSNTVFYPTATGLLRQIRFAMQSAQAYIARVPRRREQLRLDPSSSGRRRHRSGTISL